jgi:hypothetical protein
MSPLSMQLSEGLLTTHRTFLIIPWLYYLEVLAFGTSLNHPTPAGQGLLRF